MNGISKQFDVSKLEFDILYIHLINDQPIETELFSEPAKKAYETLKTYKQSYKSKAPIEFLEGICGQKRPKELYTYEFLKEQQFYHFLHIKLNYLAENTRYLTDQDPKKAYDFLNNELKSLGVSLNKEMNKSLIKFSDYAIRLERLKNKDLKTDPIIRTRCHFGLPTIDENTQGLCNGDFVLIVGQTNQGKSWLSKKIATHIATEEHKRVLIILLEEDENLAIHIVDSVFAQMDSIAYMKNELDTNEVERVIEKFNEYSSKEGEKGDIIIPDARKLLRCGNMIQICELVEEHSIDVVIIDQLTLLAETLEYKEMSKIGLDTKTTARLLDIPIIGISQAKKDPKSIFDVGYEVIGHTEELARNADTILYPAPDSQCLELGIKYIKLLKTRRGKKDIITRNRWDLKYSTIHEVGILNPDEESTKTKFKQMKPPIDYKKSGKQQNKNNIPANSNDSYEPPKGQQPQKQFSWANV